MSEELDRIEARAAKYLTLARKQAAALARVEVACDAMDAGTAIRCGDHRTKSFAAQAIRAVIREELEATCVEMAEEKR